MKIAVITYDHPHRKTQDLLGKLLLLGIKPDVLAMPYVHRKKHSPLFKHRPSKAMDVNLACFDLKVIYTPLLDIDCHYGNYDRVLIAGAGLIPPAPNVINVHPGYLPEVRGLDALKWAIYKGLPIGVSSHIIDDEPDMGYLIERRVVPIYHGDCFFTLAMRVYDYEMDLLVKCATQPFFPNQITKLSDTNLYTEASVLHKRMDKDTEIGMIRKFTQYKTDHIIK